MLAQRAKWKRRLAPLGAVGPASVRLSGRGGPFPTEGPSPCEEQPPHKNEPRPSAMRHP
jgi:hypothetical protein